MNELLAFREDDSSAKGIVRTVHSAMSIQLSPQVVTPKGRLPRRHSTQMLPKVRVAGVAVKVKPLKSGMPSRNALQRFMFRSILTKSR